MEAVVKSEAKATQCTMRKCCGETSSEVYNLSFNYLIDYNNTMPQARESF
jgi:hypothetical protein